MTKKDITLVDYNSLLPEFKVKYDEFRIKFNNKNIYDLREEAKKMFIPSPTTFSKRELVERLVSKVMLNYMDFSPEDNANKEIHIQLMEDFHKADYIEGVLLDGYLMKKACDAEILGLDCKPLNVLLPQGIINELGLRSGDLLRVKAREVTKDVKGVFAVKSIAGNEDIRADRPLFENIMPVKTDCVMTFAGKSVHKGGRCVASSLSIDDIALMTEDCARQNVHTAAIFLDEFPENVCRIDQTVAGARMYAMLDAETEEMAKKATYMLDIAKRYAESGEDAVLFVVNLDSLPFEIARKILGAARNFEKGSLTVVAHTCDERLRVIATDVL